MANDLPAGRRPAAPRRHAATATRTRGTRGARPAVRRGARSSGRSLLILLLAVLWAGVLLGTAGVVGAFAYYSRDLPSPQTIAAQNQFQSSKIFDRNGVLLYEVYDPNRGRRVAIPLAEMPQPLIDGFLAAEDARFYENSGVDLQAILRAAFGNVIGRGPFSGASTITQQLVRSSVLTNERTLSRKIREAILSIQVSR
ncbi:MAG: transglycosylase domain-containing protein, partial [Chloroflexota bacterium]